MSFLYLLRDFDLLSVVLHAASLALEAVALGGVFYAVLVLRSEGPWQPAHRRLAVSVSLALAAVQAASVAVAVAVLADGSNFPLGSLLGTDLVRSSGVEVGGALLLAAVLLPRRPRFSLAVVPCMLVLAGAVAQTHAASSLQHRPLLLALTALHHLSVAAWVGGLPYLLLSLRAAPAAPPSVALSRRFSWLAVVCVPALVATGVGLSLFYIGSWRGLYGTAYGIMLLAKCYLLLLMLALGFGNYRLLRAPQVSGLLRLRRFGEAEIGLGLTAILAAASLTAQSPAVDLPQDQLTAHQIVQRLQWQPPRLTSPALRQLAPPSSLSIAIQKAPYSDGSVSDANDRAWSEYNHHWAGLIVLACGLLALAGRMLPPGSLRSAAAQWPLLFLALGLFILLRADPENWPLGPRPFWASFSAPDVLEHRLYAVLVAGFAMFEWAVETGRWRSRAAAYTFPLLLAFAGAALLTHSHGLSNLRDETLIDISHTAIAVLGATAGWARWLELRLHGTRSARVAAFVWPLCLALTGLVLLDYRES